MTLERNPKVGEVMNTDEETFNYFLDVLPPVWMNRTINIDGKAVKASFGFAEGCDNVMAFWHTDGAYFCCLTPEVSRGW